VSLNDKAALVAAVGYVFVAPPGTARPTPSELKSLDPATYGQATQILKLTGTPTGGDFTLNVGGTGAGKTTAAIPFDADPHAIQTALEALTAVGAGNVTVSGKGIEDTAGVSVAFSGTAAAGAAGTTTITATTTGLTGGTTPAIAVTAGDKGNAWVQVGHTSRGDLPEFGQDGAKTELRGSWQNEALREVQTEAGADFMSLWLLQIDNQAFELYYGANASKTSGVFGVAGGAQKPLEKALLVVIVDGDRKVAFYSPKASFKRDDSIELAVDDFAALPIRATFLSYGSAPKMEWVAETFT
jgi:hypothetical protein